MMKKIVKVLKHILIAFVLISIGFALGKHSVSKKIMQEKDTNKISLVRVYYIHGTLRCATCNSIQKMTEALLKKQFAKEMADGKIEFSQVNFQENDALAKRFNVLSSSVIVAKIQAGKILEHQTLNKVWELFQKPAEFNAYLSKAIERYLPPQGEDK
ncbi:MAG: hypothetical protein KOO69_06625 [Victivallales bacterium]|nr:hypothetical protein [Victivallales bacterium]